LKGINLKDPDQILYQDPLSDSTRAVRRNLLAFSVIVLVAVSYGPESVDLPMTKLPASAVVGALGAVVLYHLISFLIAYSTEVQGWRSAQRILINEEHLKALRHLSSRMAEVDGEFTRISAEVTRQETVYKEQMQFLSDPFLKFITDNEKVPCQAGAVETLRAALKVLEKHAKPPLGKQSILTKVEHRELNGVVVKLGEAIRYLASSAIDFRKQERLITRESAQIRLLQGFKVYAWEGVLPVAIAGFAVLKVFDSVFEFAKSLW